MATGGTHSQGVFTKMLLEPGVAPHTFDASSEVYEYLNHNVRANTRLGGHHGIRGTRARPKVRVRKLSGFIFGTINMYISPADFVTLLPKLMSNTEVSGNVNSLAEDLPYFGALLDLDYNTVELKNCKVDRWLLRSRAYELNEEGEPDLLQLQMTVMGSEYAIGTSWPGSPPALGVSGINNNPLIFGDCDGAVTMVGDVRPITEFVFGMNHFMYARYVNALWPHSIMPRDREIGFACKVPWISDNSDLIDQSYAGAAASLVFTNDTVSTTITLNNLHVPTQTPAPERGKEAVELELNGFSTADGTSASDLEVQITNDATVGT